MSDLIVVTYYDEDGEFCVTRFSSEYYAIRFEESLDAQGLEHKRGTGDE